MKKSKTNIKQSLMGLLTGLVIGGILILPGIVCPQLKAFFKTEMVAGGGVAFMLYWLAAMAIMGVAFYLQIIIHEAGHLVFGLLSGYKFVSFRVGSFIIMRSDNGQLKCGHFSIMGTAGQCLLEPPTENIEDAYRIPYKLYGMGGVIANIVVAIVAFVMAVTLEMGVLPLFSLIMLGAMGIVMALMNGIPLKMSVPNDGYDVFVLGDDKEFRRLLWLQLKINAQHSRGVKLADMPEEWFALPDDADLSNPMYAAVVGFRASRFEEKFDFENEWKELKRLYDLGTQLIPLYRMETACDMLVAAVALRLGREQIMSFMTEEVIRYAKIYSNNLASRAVTYYVWQRFVEQKPADKEAAQVRKIAEKSPMRGSAANAVALLEWLESLDVSEYAVD